MKSVQLVMSLFALMFFAGCGDSGSNSSVAENADAKAIADYEANIKAMEEAETAAMSK